MFSEIGLSELSDIRHQLVWQYVNVTERKKGIIKISSKRSIIIANSFAEALPSFLGSNKIGLASADFAGFIFRVASAK